MDYSNPEDKANAIRGFHAYVLHATFNAIDL